MPHSSQRTERTPLLTVVRIDQRPPRYPHSNVRRVCTALLAAILLVAAIIFLLFLFVIPDCEDFRRHNHRNSKICLSKHPFYQHHDHYGDDNNNNIAFLKSGGWARKGEEGLDYDGLLDVLADTPSEEKVKEWSRYYTSGPHLAGKNLSQAEWTRDRWREFGIQAEIVAYDIYTNYPKGHRLALLEKKGGKLKDSDEKWKIKYEAKLEENVYEEDGTSGLKDRIPTFHGYSANGNVTASYVFCNYGTYQDFEDLSAANVSLKGHIALVKYGGVFRGLKVKRAQELGMVGAVLYSDPGDDGDVREEYGNKTYPDGPAREPSSVQRGSVQFLSFAPGDPTTPGYPSKPGAPRQDAHKLTPSIPSLPISYEDALPILKALHGHGPKASSFNKYWQTGGLGYKGVKYYIGPTPSNVTLNLVNEVDYVTTPQWDVIGVINGTLADEVVLLGNHRDAWIAGGAGDPNSGSAALNEVIRSFGVALSKGWKPLRTIVFGSWDGEEYGLLGSTEWVEEYLPWLSQSAIAYLNVDVGTRGPNFEAAAAPLLNQALIEATKLVLSPNQTVKGQTVYDTWDKRIRTMGSGSDFTAFQDFAGVPSLDMGFGADRKAPIYHYHSNYDSFDWMENYGDPGWHYHATISRLWAILAAKLVETAVVPFKATEYSTALLGYLKRIEDMTQNETELATFDDEHPAVLFNPSVVKSANFTCLQTALEDLHASSLTFDAKAVELQQRVNDADIPWWRWWQRVKLYYAIRKVNDRYKYLERQFLYQKGFDKRPWFKHVVFAPGIWTGYAGATFPQLVESVETGDLERLEKWTNITAELVGKAVKLLEA